MSPEGLNAPLQGESMARPFLLTHVLRYTVSRSIYITLPKLWGIEPSKNFKVDMIDRDTGKKSTFIKSAVQRGNSVVLYIPKKFGTEPANNGSLVDLYIKPYDGDVPEDSE